MPAADRDAIVQLLVKVSRTPPGNPVPISSEEHTLLNDYLQSRLADADLSERERAFCTQVSNQLACGHSPTGGSERSRANLVLRAGIDKCEANLFTEVTEQELLLMRQTAAQLDALASPTSAHERLKEKIVAALSAHQAHAAQNESWGIPDPTPIEPPSGGVSRTGDDLFSGIVARRVEDIAGFPVDLQLRVAEHVGNITIESDLPDDTLLNVRGSVTVKGNALGHVHASETIWLNGNTGSGLLVADRGDIFCERGMNGARIVAPSGSVRMDGADRCAFIFAGKQLRIEGNAQGDTISAASINMGGALSAHSIQCLSHVYADAIKNDGAQPPRIQFRRILSTDETGRVHAESANSDLKDHVRIRMRRRVSETMYARSIEDQRAVWRLMLYVAKSGGAGTPDAKELRDMQARAHFFRVLAAAAAAFFDGARMVSELTGHAARVTGIAVEDETQQAAAFIERECGRLSPELAADAKAELGAACGKLLKLARQVKETFVQEAPLDEALAAIASLRDTFETAGEVADGQLHRWRPDVETVLGGKLSDPKLDDGTLQAMAERIAGEALEPKPAKIVRALGTTSDFYARVMPDWKAGVESSEELTTQTEEVVGDAGVFVVSQATGTEQFVQANHFDRGVAIQDGTADHVVEAEIDTPARFGPSTDGVKRL